MKLITEQGHFWIEFDNGYTLSVFNGYGSYTENHSEFEKYMKIKKNGDIFARWESKTAEIAILNSTGDLVTDYFFRIDDSVKTVDLKELIEIINLLNTYKEYYVQECQLNKLTEEGMFKVFNYIRTLKEKLNIEEEK